MPWKWCPSGEGWRRRARGEGSARRLGVASWAFSCVKARHASSPARLCLPRPPRGAAVRQGDAGCGEESPWRALAKVAPRRGKARASPFPAPGRRRPSSFCGRRVAQGDGLLEARGEPCSGRGAGSCPLPAPPRRIRPGLAAGTRSDFSALPRPDPASAFPPGEARGLPPPPRRRQAASCGSAGPGWKPRACQRRAAAGENEFLLCKSPAWRWISGGGRGGERSRPSPQCQARVPAVASASFSRCRRHPATWRPPPPLPSRASPPSEEALRPRDQAALATPSRGQALPIGLLPRGNARRAWAPTLGRDPPVAQPEGQGSAWVTLKAKPVSGASSWGAQRGSRLAKGAGWAPDARSKGLARLRGRCRGREPKSAPDSSLAGCNPGSQKRPPKVTGETLARGWHLGQKQQPAPCRKPQGSCC